MKHTPGPWEVDKSGYKPENADICVMCGNKCICTTSHEDARLIAAAPDMLAMLEESEWSGAYHENPDYCPICVAAKDGFHGHDADCKLGNLLKRIKGAEQCSP